MSLSVSPAIDTFHEIRSRIATSCRSGSVHGRFLRGSSWSLAGMIASQGLAIVAAVAAARLLGKEGFGQLAIINSTVGMLGVVGTMGLGATANKYVAELRGYHPERAGLIVGMSSTLSWILGGIAAIGLFIAAPYVATTVIHAPQLVNELKIASLLLAFTGIATAQNGAIAGFEGFKRLARVNTTRAAVSSVLTVGGLMAAGLAGAVTGQVAAGGVGVLVGAIALRRECRDAGVRIRRRPLFAEIRILGQFAVPSFLCGCLASPVLWAAQVMLVNREAGYSELGLFNAANQWKAAILFLPMVLAQPLLPILSNVRKSGAPREYRRLLRTGVYATAGISLAAALAISLGAGLILNAYGRTFLEGRSILILLALAAAVNSVTLVANQAIISFGKMWGTFGFSCVWAAVLLGGSMALIPKHGGLGLAIAVLISYIIQGGALGFYTARLLARELR